MGWRTMARSTELDCGICIGCGLLIGPGLLSCRDDSGYCDVCVHELPVISIGSRLEDRMLVGLIVLSGALLVVVVLRLAFL